MKFCSLFLPSSEYSPDGIWNKRVLTTKSYEIFRTFLSDISYKDLDLLVISGDISSYDNQDAVDELIKIFDTVKCRIILTGGNHDFILPEDKNFFFEILNRFTHQISHFFMVTMAYRSVGWALLASCSPLMVMCLMSKRKRY